MSVAVLHHDGGVAEIRFARPDVLNVLDLATATAFAAAADALVREPAVRAILLSGEGRAFMAGGDLSYFRDLEQTDRPEASRRLIGAMNTGLLRLAEGDKPTVACVQGVAAGAGMSLALLADFAIAAEDAKFNLSYVRVAASPDCGGSPALVQLVGLRRAMEIALLSDTLDAPKALALGLLNRTVPPAALREEALKIAARLAQSAPLAIAATRRLLHEATGVPLAARLDAEMESFAALSATDDFDEALNAFFGKRPPVFQGR